MGGGWLCNVSGAGDRDLRELCAWRKQAEFNTEIAEGRRTQSGMSSLTGLEEKSLDCVPGAYAPGYEMASLRD